MRDAIEHLYLIHNNTFLLEPVLLAFYKELGYKENSFLLAYLVLPLVLNNAKITSNSKSTFNTYFDFSESSRRKLVLGLNDSIASYKQLTNRIIQHCLDFNRIEIVNMSIQTNFCLSKSDMKNIKVKSAIKIAKLFKKLEVSQIYKNLNVTKL